MRVLCLALSILSGASRLTLGPCQVSSFAGFFACVKFSSFRVFSTGLSSKVGMFVVFSMVNTLEKKLFSASAFITSSDIFSPLSFLGPIYQISPQVYCLLIYKKLRGFNFASLAVFFSND